MSPMSSLNVVFPESVHTISLFESQILFTIDLAWHNMPQMSLYYPLSVTSCLTDVVVVFLHSFWVFIHLWQVNLPTLLFVISVKLMPVIYKLQQIVNIYRSKFSLAMSCVQFNLCFIAAYDAILAASNIFFVTLFSAKVWFKSVQFFLFERWHDALFYFIF